MDSQMMHQIFQTLHSLIKLENSHCLPTYAQPQIRKKNNIAFKLKTWNPITLNTITYNLIESCDDILCWGKPEIQELLNIIQNSTNKNIMSQKTMKINAIPTDIACIIANYCGGNTTF